MNKKILVIIPARAGSKGLYRKNTKNLNGNPLISYTIEAAKKSKYIDKTIVSTEDIEFAEISKRYGAEVPFLRPINLAQDDTPTIDVILHCIEYLRSEQEYIPDYICLMQCTSPFRDEKCLDEAIERLIEEDVDSIVSVCESETNPYWLKEIENGKLVDFISSKNKATRRQDLPKVYKLNGAIYICKTDILIKNKSWYTENTIPYVMDNISSIDIDTILDFKFAEVVMKERRDNL
ncbi:cytidylyltransferase domain-containing protein [Clostridium hydrogeniformans]|uniref:acylneuraminate cytidylyltransferase family protein n=1 Tax=Clostridium hydrogeniformans TaxID=349933 RepID=UPI00047F3479|nr:acylneuraminate cytidylyltransferase family protein [Clostridium hydrogeniformans]